MSTVTPSVDHVDDALLEDYEVEPGDGPGPGGHPFAVSSEAGWGKSGIQSHHHVAIAGSAKRTSVEDAVLCLGLGTPPAFELHGELFHVFISYRVKTEGGKDGGNSLAGNLYKYLRQLSNGEEELNIPSAACGLYPRFAKKLLSDDSANKPTVAKVYLDVECLQDGQAWMVGFVQGLSVSIVAVLLMSWTEEGGGSVGALCSLKEDSDYVDNVLLEWIIALELKTHPAGSVKAIMPILVGHPRITDPFPQGKTKMLPDIVARKTNSTAAIILRKLGVSDDQIKVMEEKTVKNIVSEVLAHQGIVLDGQKSEDGVAISESAKRILRCCLREVDVMSSSPAKFVSLRPMGQEVMEWLEENVIETYGPLLAINGLDNLLAISRLKDDRIKQLALDHRAMYCHKGVMVKPHLGDLDDFERAIALLKDDERAKNLDYRLESFRDPKVSTLGMLVSTNAIELVACSPQVQVLWGSISVAMVAFLVQNMVLSANLTPGYTLVTGEGNSEVLDLDDLVCYVGMCVFFLLAIFIMYSVNSRSFTPRGAVKFIFRMTMFLTLVFVAASVTSIVQCSFDDDVSASGSEAFANCQSSDLDLLFALIVFTLGMIIKYRQEYAITVYLILSSVIGLYWWYFYDFASKDIVHFRYIAVLFVPIIVLVVMYTGVYAARVKANRLASLDVQSYRKMWSKITDTPGNKETLEALAVIADEKARALNYECRLHFAKSSYIARLLFMLRTRDDKFAKLRKSFKCRQFNKNLDVLFSHAALINVPFQNLVDSLLSKIQVAGDRRRAIYLKRGPVKKPERAIEKVFRSYRRDCASLTDLVRSTVVAEGCQELLSVVQEIFAISAVAGATWKKGEGSTSSKIFRLVGIKNRFKIDYDDRGSAGYRNLSINVEVGWEMEDGAVVFKPVSGWGNTMRRHICELQVHLAGLNGDASPEKHMNYVQWRNTLTR